MKKVLLGFGLAVVFGMSSCATETCYSCTSATFSGCTVDVCGGNASANVGSSCNSPATAANVLYDKNDDIKNYLENVGFTCTKK